MGLLLFFFFQQKFSDFRNQNCPGMVILYFCREARGAALPLRSPGFPAPEEGQGCPGECAGVWGQSVIILCHVVVAGCLGVPGGEVSLAG